MIKINLLPPEKIKAKKDSSRASAPPSSATPFVAIILILVYIVAIAFAYWVIKTKMDDDKKVVSLTQNRDNLKKNVESRQKEFKELLDLRMMLSNQIEILKSLDPPDRLLWAEKINMMADIVPKGVYLTNIVVTEDLQEVETEESKNARITWEKGGKKGNAPPSVKKPLVTQTLAISGVTWHEDADQRLQLIMKFHDGMKNYSNRGSNGKTRNFMDNFQDLIGIEGTYEETVAGRPINRFKLILKTKPQTVSAASK
ncbi:MAG: hypothetical protein BWY12_00691 [candidate division BRC1 bacterium ADurb.Bin183]|nr:MAG: hypothetical protein BWY12_00691 [candidate division BRC1 bacterium ADurb.Bin183]